MYDSVTNICTRQEITATSHAKIRTAVSRRVSISVIDANLQKANMSNSSDYGRSCTSLIYHLFDVSIAV